MNEENLTDLFNKLAEELKEESKKNFKKIDSKLSKLNSEILKSLISFNERSIVLTEKINEWEESMLFILHNIKKNQFLYSHYPDQWVKDYYSIKSGLKIENIYMDNKVNEDKQL